MARRLRGRRIVLLAAIVVALSIGIVFASIPKVPKPHGSLQATETKNIGPGSPNSPGADEITLAGIPDSNSFSVAVSVTPGNATFCVTQLPTWVNWQIQDQFNHGTPFPPLDQTCILHETTAHDTISFTPPTTGDWSVVALNMNAYNITVVFSPA